MTATVVSIHIAPAAAAPASSVSEARAVAGRGLEGDRYFDNAGTFSEELPGPDSELTLIEVEEVEALRSEYGVEIEPADIRRNIVTRGVSLNDLIGLEFRVGEARVRGLRLAEPCNHLVEVTGEPRVLDGLVHKAGIRAQILADGVIRVGDTIERD